MACHPMRTERCSPKRERIFVLDTTPQASRSYPPAAAQQRQQHVCGCPPDARCEADKRCRRADVLRAHSLEISRALFIVYAQTSHRWIMSHCCFCCYRWRGIYDCDYVYTMFLFLPPRTQNAQLPEYNTASRRIALKRRRDYIYDRQVVKSRAIVSHALECQYARDVHRRGR